MSNSDFLLRSLMFVPAHNDRLLDSAARSNADVLLLDLEDSVQPQQNKQIARNKIIERIETGQFHKHHVFPRVNDRESGELLRDLLQLTIDGVDGFMYPKAKLGEDIYFIDKLLETIEYEKGFPLGHFKIIPIIETTAAVLNAQDICKASKRVLAIAFGCEDFVADLQGVHDSEEQSIYTACANGVVPIDTVHIRVHDLEDLEKNLVLPIKFGFQGMLVLNPKELPLIHEYFSPCEEDVAETEEMLELYKEAEENGKGVAVKNGKFIGPPMVVKAKKVLTKHHIIVSRSE